MLDEDERNSLAGGDEPAAETETPATGGEVGGGQAERPAPVPASAPAEDGSPGEASAPPVSQADSEAPKDEI